MQKVVVEGFGRLEYNTQLMFFEDFFGFFDDAFFALYVYCNVNSAFLLNDFNDFTPAFPLEVHESF